MSLQLVQHSAWQLLLQRSLIPFLCAEISLVGVSDLTPFPVGAGAGRSVLETCPGAGRGGSPRAAVPDPGGSGRALAPSLPPFPTLGRSRKPEFGFPRLFGFCTTRAGTEPCLPPCPAAHGHPDLGARPPPPQRAQQLQKQVSPGRGMGTGRDAGCCRASPAEGCSLPSAAQVSVWEGDKKEEMHLSPADPRPPEPPQQGAAGESPRRGREQLLRAEEEREKQICP